MIRLNAELAVGHVAARFHGESENIAALLEAFRHWCDTGHCDDRLLALAGRVTVDQTHAPVRPLDPSDPPLDDRPSPAAPVPAPAASPTAGPISRGVRADCDARVLAGCSEDWRPLAELRRTILAERAYGYAAIDGALQRLTSRGLIERAGPDGRPAANPNGYRTIRLTAVLNSRPGPPRGEAPAGDAARPDPGGLAERRVTIRQALDTLFVDDTRRRFDEIATVARVAVGAHASRVTFEDVTAVLGDLVRAQRIGMRSVGLERLYQRRR